MLETLRNATKTWVVKLLFGLLVLSFVAWGVGDVIRGGLFGRGPAIEVGGTAIPAGEVASEFKREVERLQPLFGGKLSSDDARKLGLLDRTIDTVVTRTLIDEAARRLGLAASDEAVVRQVADEPAFRNELGHFDRDRLRSALARAGLSEADFLRIEKKNLMRSQMAEALTGGLEAPAALVDPLVRVREERRVAEVISVRDDSIAAPAAPDAAALEQYYKDNAQRFMAPETRALTVLQLRPADVQNIEVTDDMVADAYKQRLDEFTTHEKREIAQVVLPDEASAAKAGEAVAQGKDLAAVAKATGQQVTDLGMVERGDLPEELAAAAFRQAPNSIAEPVRTPLGWHVIRIGKVVPARSRPLAEVSKQLAEELRREKAVDGLSDLANQVEDALAGGATLEETAKRFNLRLTKIEAIDARGLGRDGKPVTNRPAAEAFLDVAFHTDQGTESQLTDSDGDGYFLVRVDQVTPPQPKPFETIRNQVLAAWQAEKRHELAGQRAENLAEHIRHGEPAGRSAQAFGLRADTTAPFTREGEAGVLPAPAVQAMFEAGVGGVTVAATPEGWVVARLAKVVPFDPAANRDATVSARRAVTAAVSGDLVDQFIAALKADYGVKVDRSQLTREE